MTMQSRRDLFQAHRLMTQRAALALLRGEPDIPDQPIRRINVGTFSGILVAVIAVAGFGIWGLLFHGAPALSYVAGTLIIDKQTGTNYVFCGSGHKEICPMTNHASALLALASDQVNTEVVNQSSLTTIKHGPLLGILGLPQDLPGASLLVKQPWSVCIKAGNITGQITTTVAGGTSTGGQPLGDNALVVTSPNGLWVIWNNTRFPISQDTQTVAFPEASAFGVPSVWLDSIPQGQPFQAPAITDPGATVTGPAGPAKVGQLYQANGVPYVLLNDGHISPITPLQERLLSTQSQQQPLAESDVTGHTDSPLPTNGLPNTVPQLSSAQPPASSAQPPAPFCVVYSGSSLSLQVETGGRVPSGGTPTGDNTSGDVNSVALPPGKAALVQETGNNVSYFLVTDGLRYSLASNEVPGFLGYSTSQAVQLPAGFLDLIPAGPGFDPSEANDVVTGSSG